MTDFIRLYEGDVESSLCEDLTTAFERQPAQQQPEHTPGYRFTSLSLWEAAPTLYPQLLHVFERLTWRYLTDVGMGDWRLAHAGHEKIRLKRYRPDQDECFPPHLDVRDYASARRYLALLLYLNDVEEGGATVFPQWGVEVQPKAGRVLVFPPTLPFLHAGATPVQGVKYIAMTYAHFR